MTDSATTPRPGCDDLPPGTLHLEQALERIRALLQPIEGFEQVAIRDALGRILAEEVFSPRDVPAYTNSAMDGYALKGDELPASGSAEFTVVGTAFAGHPYTGSVNAGEAVRIMTGAMLPAGADTVIMQEHAEREDDTLRIGDGHRAGQNVRYAGEDIAADSVVLTPGHRIMPAEIALLASLGIPEVKVRRRLRVAFFSTGDELRSIGQPLEPGQLYDSNRYSLYGMLKRLEVETVDMGVIPDDREAIANAFLQAADCADVVLTSGGVSVGEADYVKETLERLGRVDFWKIAMKPGKPLAFGKVKEAVFFGLPGNPVSTMATFYQVVQPSLRHLMGQPYQPPLRFRVRCTSALKKSPGRLDFQRGILYREADGSVAVKSVGGQGSHMLSTMSRGNCFIVLPAERGNVAVGDEVEVEPFDGLL